jgi:hypothetical protein
MSPATLDQVLDKTAEMCHQHLSVHNAGHNSNSDNSNSDNSNSSDNSNTLHLVVTGSLHIPTPGKELPDWQGHWSAGEHVLAQLIPRIGLNAFAVMNRQGRLHARLLDINWKNTIPSASPPNTVRAEDETTNSITTTTTTHSALPSNNNYCNQILINNDPSLSFAVHELCRFIQRRKITALAHATIVLPVTLSNNNYYDNNTKQQQQQQTTLATQFQKVWNTHWDDSSPMRQIQFLIVPVYSTLLTTNSE